METKKRNAFISKAHEPANEGTLLPFLSLSLSGSIINKAKGEGEGGG